MDFSAADATGVTSQLAELSTNGPSASNGQATSVGASAVTSSPVAAAANNNTSAARAKPSKWGCR